MSRSFEIVLTLARGIPEAVVLLDPTFRSLYYNPAYLRLSGLSRGALEARLNHGESPLTIVGQQGEADLTIAQSCITEQEAITLAEVIIRNTEGEAFTASLTFLPIIDESNGVIEGVLEIIRDQTAEKTIQERFKKMLAAEKERATELERKVEERTRELEEALSHLTRLSRLDPLTGLLNRRAFSERADQVLSLARRYNRTVALFICDLDHFKRINDRYGHPAGDALLVAVSEEMLKSVRSSDSVARLGGEEFMILLAEIAPDSGLDIAERCAAAIRSLPLETIIPEASGRQTVSIGVALSPLHGDSLATLIRHADQALYRAKDLGRDRIVVYDRSLGDGSQKSPTVPATKALLIDGDHERLRRYVRDMAEAHRISTATSVSLAAELWRREHFDVLVIDEAILSESGIDLRAMEDDNPLALRVLVTTEGRSTHHDGIHFTLSRTEAATQLGQVVQSGLTWREADAQSFDRANWRAFALKNIEQEQLERLLDERKLRFVYQPIIRVEDRSCFGYEALVRVGHSLEHRPRSLVEAALRTRNLWKFGRLVRELAAQPLPALPPDTTLFINIHPEEMDDPWLVEPGILPAPRARQIVLEISEGSAITDYTRLHRRMDQIRELGYRFAIDDLGSAYAGLKSIAMLDPEFIKLDMELVRGIASSRVKLSLVRKVIDFCNESNIIVVAEGVETAEEAAALAQLGCHLWQGYYFGQPAELPETRSEEGP